MNFRGFFRNIAAHATAKPARATRGLASFGLIFGLALALASCTNNSLRNASSNLTDDENPLDKVIAGGDSSLTLVRVVKNALAPTSTFDLIGDGSGAFGVNCTGTQGSAQSNTGPSTCTCSYTYKKSDGSTESFEAPTTYFETNVVRCLYTGMPAAVTQVGVRLHVTTSDSYSNEVTYKFAGTGLTLDTASALTFVQVQRYQCRDVVTVPYLFDPGRIYDPFQSEDPQNSYPLNFYSTNMGGTFSIYAGGLNGLQPPTLWNCPSIPNDPNAGLDLTVFSVSADSAGSKRIYPPAGSAFDRSTFHVARKATGVFNVPVNAYIAPTIFSVAPDSQGNQSGPAPIGYGAAPIPTGVSGQETCPDASVPIPSGYHWVKVWPFRMALPQRKFVSSINLQRLGNIDCAVGEWIDKSQLPAPGTDNDFLRAVFPDCYNKAADGATRATDAVYITELSGLPAGTLASRFFEGTGACVNIDPDFNAISGIAQGPGRTTNSATGALLPAYAGYPIKPGTDVWNPNNRDTTYRCNGPGNQDFAHLCPPSLPGRVPYDNAPVTGNIDADPSSTRFDFLFVVSPPSVMSGDMINTSSAVHNTYTPYRFMAPGDCSSTDPDTAVGGDCNPQRALRNYGLKLHDVGSAGDPPADDPNRAGVFPVCALQPN